ncbi:MAG: hypothetical protein ACI9N9_002076 [Enterobacterales bacterium]|jgi:hypothetical protein
MFKFKRRSQIISQTIKILPDVLSQEVSSETVLLDLKSERYFGLNDIGTRIWQLLQLHSDFKKIHEIMLDEYDVSSEQLQKDMDKLVTKLVAAGLASIE